MKVKFTVMPEDTKEGKEMNARSLARWDNRGTRAFPNSIPEVNKVRFAQHV